MKIKALTRSDRQPDRDDVEARHRRHEEREADRAAQRDRELMCLPLEEWPAEHQRDLEYEIARIAKAPCLQPTQGQGPLPGPGSVNPFWPDVDASGERA